MKYDHILIGTTLGKAFFWLIFLITKFSCRNTLKFLNDQGGVEI